MENIAQQEQRRREHYERDPKPCFGEKLVAYEPNSSYNSHNGENCSKLIAYGSDCRHNLLIVFDGIFNILLV